MTALTHALHTPPVFSYRHVISFEETNVVGNVYFARHVAWQGACREMFLRAHAPSVLDEIGADLRLVTLSVACDYFQELRAFDEVVVNMALAHVTGNRIGLDFDYRLQRGEQALQCARGRQEIGCMREPSGQPGRMVPCDVPAELMRALRAFLP